MKTKSIKKWLVVGLLIVVTIACACDAVCIVVSTYNRENLSDNQNIVMSAKEARGISLLSYETPAGVTVTATVSPSTATNKNIEWELAWSNPDSAYASGKTVTDYVTVTPTSAGSATATVNCIHAFAEQIKLLAISESNPGVYASINIDYRKRYEGVDTIVTDGDYYSFEGTTLHLDDVSDWGIVSESGTDNWNFTFSYGVGTIDALAASSFQCYVKPSEELKSHFSTAPISYVSVNKNAVSLLEKGLGVALYKTVPKPGGGTTADGEQEVITTFDSKVWNNVVSALSSLTGHALDLKLVLTLSDSSTAEIMVPIYVSKDSIGAAAASVSVSTDNIVF